MSVPGQTNIAVLFSAEIEKSEQRRPIRCDDEGRVIQLDYITAVARGMVPGAGLFRQIGRNSDVDNTREDCWETGGDYVFPPAGGIQMRAVSTDNTNDAAAGAGARTVDIHYLDAAGVPRITTLTMTGTTPVLTTPVDIWRIQDFHIRTAGSTGRAAGSITLTGTDGIVTYATISAGNGRTRQAVWTVPAGKRAFVVETLISGNATGGGVSDYLEGYLRVTSDSGGEYLPGVFQFKSGIIQSNSGAWATTQVPEVCPALSDIKMSIQSRSASSNVLAVAGFAGWYEDEAP